MTVRLQSSFLRSTIAVLTAIVGVALVSYLWQGYHQHHWWTREYILSLMIPAVIAPLAVWLMFVPRRLEFSDTVFTIQFYLRCAHTLKWEGLKYYGRGNNVFILQFAGKKSFQIFSHSFPKAQWQLLANFLANRYPERKASGWIGPFGFKWPWRQNHRV